MDVLHYVAIFVFAMLSTAIGYMVCVRMRRQKELHVDVPAVARAPLAEVKASK